MLKRTKKGFTLAELLIVVAIIAVLTAIAVPLFVTSLEKANEAAFNANKDAVRSAGLAQLLGDDKFDLTTVATDDVIVVTGTFENGKLASVKVKVLGKDATTLSADDKETDYSTWKTNKKTGSLIVHLKVTDVAGNVTPKPVENP